MKSHLFLLCILFLQTQLLSQPISGYVKNNSLQGLEDKLVEVYMTIDGSYVIDSDLTTSNGYFVTGTYTNVEDEQSQIEGIVYTAGSNSANIEISTTSSSNVIIKLFDITGQEVYRYQGENAGKKIYSLPIKQLANALYISMVTVNGRTDVNKILSIDDKLYFGKTSSSIKKNMPNKKSLASTLDSIIVSGEAIKKTTFTYNLSISGSYSVSDLVVDSNYVNLTLNVIKLMEWKQANNQLTNATVNVSGIEKTADNNGQAIFEHLPSGKNTLIITHPQIYDRETILRLENDSTHTEYILDKLNFTSAMMDFYNDVFGRIWPGWGYQMSRWTEPPIFYIVADTTQEPGRWRALQQINKINDVLAPAYTSPEYPEGFLNNYQVEIGLNPPYHTPGYYVIQWGNIAPYGGLTSVNSDTSIGKILYAKTTYNELLDEYEMDRVTIHELSTGMSAAGRSNALSSVWNLPVPSYEERNFTATDKQMILYQYTRPPGNKIIDKDDGY